MSLLANFGKPRPMTQDDIEDVINRFARSAELVKEAGFTGVQIHCAHGYLLSQFLSPKINQRTDQWAGLIAKTTTGSVNPYNYNGIGYDFEPRFIELLRKMKLLEE